MALKWPSMCWCAVKKLLTHSPTSLTDPVTTVTRSTSPFLSEWAKCQSRNTKNGGTVLPIANLMADSESGSPDSYSSFLVILRLSRLVLEIIVRDRQTDKRITQTIIIAGPHIVVGQIKISLCFAAWMLDCTLDNDIWHWFHTETFPYPKAVIHPHTNRARIGHDQRVNNKSSKNLERNVKTSRSLSIKQTWTIESDGSPH